MIITNSNDLRKDLIEEFKLLQQKISNWDTFSLSIKNWAITIWVAILVFIGTQYYTHKPYDINLANLFWATLLLPFPFWIFDGLFKFFQRLSMNRSHAIEDYLNNKLEGHNSKEEKRLKKKEENYNKKNPKMKTNIKDELEKFKKEFPRFDPVSRISKTHLFFDWKYNRKTHILICLFVRMVTTIYLILIILTITLIAIITSSYMRLWWLFLLFSLLSLSWILSYKTIV